MPFQPVSQPFDMPHKVMMDKEAFTNRIRGYQSLADRMRAISASKNTNLSYVTISKKLIAEENYHAVKTRVPGTWGKDVRYVWLHKDNVMDIHNGKTMLTFLDTRKDYKLYDEQNRVVTTKKGEDVYKRQVNMQKVALEERLSNQVYHYDKDLRKLTLATDTPNKSLDGIVAEPQLVYDNGNTPFTLAKEAGSQEIENLLLQWMR